MSGDPNGIFHALAHRIRRGIIRALGEKRELSFTDLLKELGIVDSSLLAFHMKKLEGFVRRNERGYYELTSTGWKAYRVLKELERESVGDELAKAMEARASRPSEEVREVEEGIVKVSDMIAYTLTRGFIHDLAEKGKKLIIEDVVALDVLEDVDKEELSKVLKEIRNVVAIRAPTHLIDVISSRAKEVLAITGLKDRAKVVSTTYVPKFVSGLVSDVVKRTLKSLSIGLKGALLTISIPESRKELRAHEEIKPKVTLKASGSNVRVYNVGDGAVEVDGRGDISTGDLSTSVSDNELIINVAGANVDVGIPSKGIEELSMDLAGSDLSFEDFNAPSLIKMKLSGSDISGKLLIRSLSNLILTSVGSEVNLNLEINEVRDKALVSVRSQGDDVNLRIKVPKDCLVRLSTPTLLGSDLSVSVNGRSVPINYLETGEGPELIIEINSEYSDVSINLIKEK